MKRIHEDHNGVYVLAFEDGGDLGHEYQIEHAHVGCITTLSFQSGPIPSAGVNGVTNESLLAVLAHRLRFLDDKFPCEENKAAIQAIDAAALVLLARTLDRIARGVEGQHLL
jgi:hypothetical protein